GCHYKVPRRINVTRCRKRSSARHRNAPSRARAVGIIWIATRTRLVASRRRRAARGFKARHATTGFGDATVVAKLGPSLTQAVIAQTILSLFLSGVLVYAWAEHR